MPFTALLNVDNFWVALHFLLQCYRVLERWYSGIISDAISFFTGLYRVIKMLTFTCTY